LDDPEVADVLLDSPRSIDEDDLLALDGKLHDTSFLLALFGAKYN
jgi:hypothetical protein